LFREAVVTAPSPTPAPGRWLFVDVCRGLAVAGMLLVDYQGSAHAYGPLKHAQWNGWTAADLVFPSFVFVMGISVALSIRSRLARGDSPAEVFRHATTRTLILIALGVVLNGFPGFDLATWRLLGVVQRIAVCYLVAVGLRLWSGTRAQVVAVVLLLLGYWALLRLVPVPGFGLPGRDIPFLDPEGNLTAWLDRAVFPGRLYDTVRDPEGLLSTLPSIATGLLGLLTGRWLISTTATGARKATTLLLAGIGGLAAGALWGLWFPINKNLWTSSYVALSAGFTLVLLSFLYWVIEVRGGRGAWTMPFLVFGMNAILGFVLDLLIWLPMAFLHVRTADGTAITWKSCVLDGLLLPYLGPANASLVYAVGMTTACWLLLYPLYRKRLFVKV
jgi:predicted acyltransferase